MHYYHLFHWILPKKVSQWFPEGNLLWLWYLKENIVQNLFCKQIWLSKQICTSYCLVIFLEKLTFWGCIKKYFPVRCPFTFFCEVLLKGTVMRIEKSLMNDRLRVSKAPRKFSILTIYNFEVIQLWSFLFC